MARCVNPGRSGAHSTAQRATDRPSATTTSRPRYPTATQHRGDLPLRDADDEIRLELEKAIRQASSEPAKALETYRHLWLAYRSDDLTTSTIERHAAHASAELVLNRVFDDIYENRLVTKKGRRCQIHSIRTRLFPWHEELAGLRLYAIFGPDGLAVRFIKELRQLADKCSGLAAPVQLDGSRDRTSADIQAVGARLSFAKALKILSDMQYERRSGNVKTQGSSKDAVWQPSDCQRAEKAVDDLRSKIRDQQSTQLGEAHEQAELTDRMHWEDGNHAREQAEQLLSRNRGERRETLQQTRGPGTAAADFRRLSAGPAAETTASAVAEGGTADAPQDGHGVTEELSGDMTAMSPERPRRDDTAAASDQASEIGGCDFDVQDNAEDRFSSIGHEEQQPEEDRRDSAICQRDRLELASGALGDVSLQSPHLLRHANDLVSASSHSSAAGRSPDAPARVARLPRTSFEKELDDFQLPQDIPAFPLHQPIPHSLAQHRSPRTSTSKPHQMLHYKRRCSPVARMSEPRGTSTILHFKRQRLDSSSEAPASSAHAALAREFLAVFARSCTIQGAAGADTASTSSPIVAIHDLDRTDTPPSFFLALIPPNDEAATSEDLATSSAPSSLGWTFALVVLDNPSAATIEICSTRSTLPPATCECLRNVLASAAPAAISSTIRGVSVDTFVTSPLPKPLDPHIDDPVDFVKCIAVASCFLTGVDSPDRIFLWAWIGAMSAVTSVSSRRTEFASLSELPEMPEPKLEVETVPERTIRGVCLDFTRQVDTLRLKIQTLLNFKQHVQTIVECRDGAISRSPASAPSAATAKLDDRIRWLESLVADTDPLDEEYNNILRIMEKCRSEKSAAEDHQPTKRLRDLQWWANMCLGAADCEVKTLNKHKDLLVQDFKESLEEGMRLVEEQQ